MGLKSPKNFTHYLGDERLADTKLLSDVSLRVATCVISPNLLGSCGAKLCERVVYATKFSSPTLGDHVAYVIEPRTEKKMIRVKAVSNVAFMQDQKTLWNLASIKKPSHPVKALPLPAYQNACVAVERKALFPKPAFCFHARFLAQEGCASNG